MLFKKIYFQIFSVCVALPEQRRSTVDRLKSTMCFCQEEKFNLHNERYCALLSFMSNLCACDDFSWLDEGSLFYYLVNNTFLAFQKNLEIWFCSCSVLKFIWKNVTNYINWMQIKWKICSENEVLRPCFAEQVRGFPFRRFLKLFHTFRY